MKEAANRLAGKLILGTAQFGSKYGINNRGGKPSETEVFAILDEARRLGIERLDTADAYGDATSVIGRYNKEHEPFRVLNKFGFSDKDVDIIKKAEASLEILGVGAFEVYSYHSFNDFAGNPQSQKIMAELKNRKLINKIGVSVYGNPELEACLNSEIIDVIQMPFNILDNRRKKGALMDAAKKNGKELHVRSVFLQGLFFMEEENIPAKLQPLTPHLRKLKEFCEERQMSVNELALTYATADKNVDGVLFGVDNVKQLTENVDCLRPEHAQAIAEFVDTIEVKETELLSPVNWK